MADVELAEKVIEAEIVLGNNAVVASHAKAPDSYGAGFDAGYLAGLERALKALHGSYTE